MKVYVKHIQINTHTFASIFTNRVNDQKIYRASNSEQFHWGFKEVSRLTHPNPFISSSKIIY